MPQRAARKCFGRRPAPGRRGFTLIELLVVMFILAILIAFAVGVYDYVIDESNRSQTVATQKIIMAAIKAYRNVRGVWPEVDPVDDATVSQRSRNLWRQLNEEPKSRDIIARLPASAMRKPPSGGSGRFIDAWGMEIDYKPYGGFGESPVLISAGKDNRFVPAAPNPANPHANLHENAVKDNIRSDGREQ